MIKMNSLRTGLKASAIAIIVIIIFGIIRHVSGQDLIGGTVFKSKFLGSTFGESGVYSGWPISHLLLHLYLGFYCPDLWWLWLVLGVIWEIVEWAIGKQLQEPQKASKVVSKVGEIFFPQFKKEKDEQEEEETQYDDAWVRGNLSDIFFNNVGLLAGVVLRNIMDQTYKNKNKQ
jgi:hypothetical protein